MTKQLNELIMKNENNECKPTENECQMLARLCDDERIERTDIPKLMGKSYRASIESDDFNKVKKLKRQGIYSKVSALLLAMDSKNT